MGWTLLVAAVVVALVMPLMVCGQTTPCVIPHYDTESVFVGFEFDSTLGYPGEGPPVGKSPLEAEPEDSMGLWLQQVENEKIAALRRSAFLLDGSAHTRHCEQRDGCHGNSDVFTTSRDHCRCRACGDAPVKQCRGLARGSDAWTIGPRHDPPTTVSCWLGFAFNSTLGYPGEGPPTPLEFDEGTELWLQQLEDETRLIEELPCVQQVKLYEHDTNPNLNYIQATLWCCWQSSRFKLMKEPTFRTWEATAAHAGVEADAGPVAGHTYTFKSTELRAVGLLLLLAAPHSGLWLVFVAPLLMLEMQQGGGYRV
jgi:hypothetical protein